MESRLSIHPRIVTKILLSCIALVDLLTPDFLHQFLMVEVMAVLHPQGPR